jgi:hypothetical protein
MRRADNVSVEFRLGPAGSDSAVEVTIRSFGDRWTAAAAIAGKERIGLGGTPRAALVGALSSLGERAVQAHLADLALLAPSVEIIRQELAMGA